MRQEMQRRIDELSQEIRNYPTPIARCDEQLAALIEERAALQARLAEFPEHTGGCTPLGLWANDGGSTA
jgi:chorismate mutase